MKMMLAYSMKLIVLKKIMVVLNGEEVSTYLYKLFHASGNLALRKTFHRSCTGLSVQKNFTNYPFLDM